MFEDYKTKIQQRQKQVHEMFEDVGKESVKTFIVEAKSETNKQGLVKTGTYRRNWFARVKKNGVDTVIKLFNNIDYASHLEWGHRIVLRNGVDTGRKTKGRFVGMVAKNKTEKHAQRLISRLMKGIFK